MAKWLTRWPAKPLFVGSNPIPCSKVSKLRDRNNVHCVHACSFFDLTIACHTRGHVYVYQLAFRGRRSRTQRRLASVSYISQKPTSTSWAFFFGLERERSNVAQFNELSTRKDDYTYLRARCSEPLPMAVLVGWRSNLLRHVLAHGD